MFCHLEKLELKVSSCPATSCIYKGLGGSCDYNKLTTEGVTIKDISESRQMKHYKVAALAVSAKQAVITGTILISYSDYIKDSFPDKRGTPRENSQLVNNKDDKHVRNILQSVFGLTPYQQEFFWDEERIKIWSGRMKVSLNKPDIRSALLSANATEVSS